MNDSILYLNNTYKDELSRCIVSGKMPYVYDEYETKLLSVIQLLRMTNNIEIIQMYCYFQQLSFIVVLHLNIYNRYSFLVRMAPLLKYF